MQAILMMIYGVLLLIGGLMGYLKAQSSASLIMGGIFAIMSFVCAVAIYKEKIWGIYLSFAISLFLAFFFGYRFYSSLKWMPAGMMLIVSALLFLILLCKHMKKGVGSCVLK